MHRKNIVLCGFMGCGKTTVGQELAWRIFYDFVDMDERIEQVAGMTIPELFAQKGEEAFRDLESKVLADLMQGHGQVIATGGGALMRERNVELARQADAAIVFVNSEFDLCWERIKDSDRPLVAREGREGLERLFAERYPVYQRIADFEVFNQHEPKDAAKAILYSLI
ncbi:shikimate kinase [Clostridiaceae bacterium NSJ-31]|uniref:Shikimate kinase n=1 Tax=Ligaoa zhengdingensis TaxID=2763658 RepID=A0A926DY19_9FIRM|nr:shikimate kinase [Ligaoa zhengdingensis]MBC8546206.1 shikimate kinase [Ligaoa zhengdingensis]